MDIEILIKSLIPATQVATFLSLFFSMYYLIYTRRLKKRFLSLARLPENVDNLKELASQLRLVRSKNPFSPAEGYEVMIRVEQALKNTEKKLRSQVLKKCKRLINKTKSYTKTQTTPTKENTTELYSELQGLIDGINDEIKDQQWG